MALITPSVKAATLAEITPAATAGRVAPNDAALTVEIITGAGTEADAPPCLSVVTKAPPERARPRRASLRANRTRPRERPLAQVPRRPTGMRGGFLEGFRSQLAEPDRPALLARRGAYLLVHPRQRLRPGFVRGFGPWHCSRRSFLHALVAVHRLRL